MNGCFDPDHRDEYFTIKSLILSLFTSFFCATGRPFLSRLTPAPAKRTVSRLTSVEASKVSELSMAIWRGKECWRRVGSIPRAANRHRRPCRPEGHRSKRSGSRARRQPCHGADRAAARNGPGIPRHPPRRRSWWSSLLSIARWPDFESPPCAARLLVNADDGAVDEHIFEVWFLR